MTKLWSENTYVIAEIGSNHDGELDRGKKLIDYAAKCGANAVKFQSFKADCLVRRDSPSYDILKRLELKDEWHYALHRHAHDCGVDFLSTPFDTNRLALLVDVGVPAIKIASGDITYTPLLEAVGRTRLPVMLSTGMATGKEIGDALDTLTDEAGLSFPQMVLLHCVSAYPTYGVDANVRKVQTLADLYMNLVGISDHSISPLVPLAAVSMGACVVERHFTLDRSLPGPDHHYATLPDEFTQMVNSIRTLEEVLGKGELGCGEAEIATRDMARRDTSTWLRG